MIFVCLFVCFRAEFFPKLITLTERQYKLRQLKYCFIVWKKLLFNSNDHLSLPNFVFFTGTGSLTESTECVVAEKCCRSEAKGLKQVKDLKRSLIESITSKN